MMRVLNWVAFGAWSRGSSESQDTTERLDLFGRSMTRGKGRRQGGDLLKGGAHPNESRSLQLKTNDILQKKNVHTILETK